MTKVRTEGGEVNKLEYLYLLMRAVIEERERGLSRGDLSVQLLTNVKRVR